jgi:hypothetical protein
LIDALKESVVSVIEAPKGQLTAGGAMIYLRFDEWLPQTVNEAASWVGIGIGLSLIAWNVLRTRKTYLENKLLQAKLDNQDLPVAKRRCTDK